MKSMPAKQDDQRAEAQPELGWQAAVEVLLILLVFVLIAGWPPPDPNEAHYLGKAKHFWDQSWVPHDFFFNSHDTHLLFYLTFGWLTRLMPLTAAAWVGRLITWGLIACAWRRLSYGIVSRPGWSVVSATLLIVLNERYQMAGEWVIGGFEAKGLTYALVLFAFSDIVRNRWNRAWILLGAGSAFHVLVGGWSVVAAGIAWLLIGKERPRLVTMLPSLAIGGALSLVGVVPALMLEHGSPPDVVAQANQIYVFERLGHHLAPQSFQPMFVYRFGLLFCVWLLLCAFAPPNGAQRRARSLVAGSLAISLAGLLIAVILRHDPVHAAALLRFYWFRLADAMLPTGMGLQGTAVIVRCWLKFRDRDNASEKTGTQSAACAKSTPLLPQKSSEKINFAVPVTIAGLLVAAQLWFSPTVPLLAKVPRADGPGKVTNYADWRDVCQWIATHTPTDAVFLTPRSNQTFKWYAGRAEVVSWKDIPQGASELVQWWQRMEDVHGTGLTQPGERWLNSLTEETPAHLRRTAKKYGADYVLTDAEPPLALKRVYRNNFYAVYEISAD